MLWFVSFALALYAQIAYVSGSLHIHNFTQTNTSSIITLVGGAQIIPSSSSLHVVNSFDGNSSTKAGAMWSTDAQYVAGGFTAHVSFKLSSPTPEGLALVFQADGQGVAAIGGTASSLGYSNVSTKTNGIANAFVVELDSHKDGAPINDIDGKHISIHGNCGGTYADARELCSIANKTDISALHDGKSHVLMVSYDSDEHTLSIQLDDTSIIELNDFTLTDYISSGSAFVGLTSATGVDGGSGAVSVTSFDLVASKQTVNANNSFAFNGPNGAYNTIAIEGAGTFQVRLVDENGYNITSDVNPAPDVKCKITGKGDVTDITVTQDSDDKGLYDVSYTAPQQAGKYEITVSIDDTPIHGMPHTLDITGGPLVPADSIAVGDGLSNAVAGEKTTITVVGKDQYGNNVGGDGGANLQILMTAGTTVVKTKETDLQNGNYSVEYTASKVDNYNLKIQIKGSITFAQIKGSPFTVNVVPGDIDPKKCDVSGDGLTDAVCGTDATVTLTAKDSEGNDITSGGAKVAGTLTLQSASNNDVTVNANVTDEKDGTYTLSYRLTQSGSYSLEIYVNDESVSTKSYTVTATSGPALASKTSATFTVNSTIAGTPTTYVIHAVDAFGNAADNATGCDMMASVLTDFKTHKVQYGEIQAGNDTGVYTGKFQIDVMGSYRIDTLLNSVNISNSPFIMSFHAGPVNPSHCYAEGSALKEAKKNRAENITLFLRDEYDNDVQQSGLENNVTVDITSKNKFTSDSSVTDNGDGSYTVSYTIHDPGSYTLDVQISDVSIDHSPFTVIVSGPTPWILSTEGIIVICLSTALVVTIAVFAYCVCSRQNKDTHTQIRSLDYSPIPSKRDHQGGY